jgi:hypothetical protein
MTTHTCCTVATAMIHGFRHDELLFLRQIYGLFWQFGHLGNRFEIYGTLQRCPSRYKLGSGSCYAFRRQYPRIPCGMGQPWNHIVCRQLVRMTTGQPKSNIFTVDTVLTGQLTFLSIRSHNITDGILAFHATTHSVIMYTSNSNITILCTYIRKSTTWKRNDTTSCHCSTKNLEFGQLAVLYYIATTLS